MKIEFPFLWVSRGSKEWGVLLFTIGWVLWALMCAVAIRWDAWKGACGRRQKTQKAPGAENKRPAGHKSLGETCKGWYGKHERELKKTILTAALYTLLLYMAGSGYFLPEQTALHTAAGKIMQYSVLGMVGLLAAAARSFCLKSGRESYLNILLQAGSIWALAVVMAAFVSGTVQFDKMCNGLWCACLAAAAFGAMQYKVKTDVPEKRTENIFLPVVQKEELFGARRQQAEMVAKLIQRQGRDACAICITGEWGSGKTSFLNGVINELQNTRSEEQKDCVIWVRTLELDSLENLLQYLFGEIRRELKKRGAYVGLSSEYQKFLQAAAASLTTQETSGILGTRLFHTPENYREKRDALDKIIQQTMSDSLFLVVVDDIERCSADKIQQFVAFIREAATLSNCMPIFLTDYEQLMKACGTELDKKFFDKFFNERISLARVSGQEIMRTLEMEKREDGIKRYAFLGYPGEKSPLQIYKDCLTWLKEKKNMQKKDGPDYGERLQCLQEIMQSPRSMRKFYQRYSRYCENFRQGCLQEEEWREKNTGVMRDIGLEKLIWLVSFIEISNQMEEIVLQERGFLEYFRTLGARVVQKISTLTDTEEGLFIDLNVCLLRNNRNLNGYTYQLRGGMQTFEEILWRYNTQKKYHLFQYKNSAAQLAEKLDDGEALETINRTQWEELIEYVMAENYQDETGRNARQDFVSMLELAAERQKKDNRWSMVLLNGLSDTDKNSVWFDFEDCMRLISEKYCSRVKKTWGWNSGVPETLRDFERWYCKKRFENMTLLCTILGDEEHRRVLEKRMNDQVVGFSGTIEEHCNEYLKKLRENLIGQVGKLGDIGALVPTATHGLEAYRELYNNLKGYFENEGMMQYAAIRRMFEKIDREIDDMGYACEVVKFFDIIRPNNPFQRFREKKGPDVKAENVLDYILSEESRDYADDLQNLANLERMCEEKDIRLPKTALERLSQRIEVETNRNKKDKNAQNALFRIRAYWLRLKKWES